MTQQQSVAGSGIDRRAIPVAAREDWWTAADGQRIRRIDWPGAALDARGSLLFLPGRGDFYEKYLEVLDHWHACGWRVTAIDWRGQGSSGRFGGEGVPEPDDEFGIWTADLAHFWRQWTAEGAAPHVLIAHSMGGHIALRALADKMVRPDAAVLSAPMLGLQPQFVPRGVLYRLARRLARVRGARTVARNNLEQAIGSVAGRFDRLTHDAERYADEIWWRQERPQLGFAAPTWGWIEQALASMGELERPGLLEAMDIPTLILAVRSDRLVSWRAIREAAARLPRCEMIAFGEGARHELLREADGLRDRAIAAIDRFLDETVPAGEARL